MGDLSRCDHVYLALMPDGQLKIGISGRVAARLKDLSSVKEPAKLLRVWYRPADAARVERIASNLLCRYRTGSRYDFFRAPRRDVSAAIRKAIRLSERGFVAATREQALRGRAAIKRPQELGKVQADGLFQAHQEAA